MSLAIETHQLTRYYNDYCAVAGIDLAVERGTFYGFLGPNGAGKSTTIKMLTGLLAPSGGQMMVLGRNMLDPSQSLDAKRHVGVIPEDLALFDNLTAREYLTFVGRIHLMSRETIRSRSEELLSLLDLQGEDKKLTLEYSHGMKKKLAMAAALLPNPDLLFLDEPFEGVDAVTSRVIRDLMSLIGLGSLWRAYLTTLRIYRGQFTAGQGRPVPEKVVREPSSSARPVGVLLLERKLPRLSEPVSAIALAGLRGLLRAPEAKMMLLAPVILCGVFGMMLWKAADKVPTAARPLLGIAGITMFYSACCN